MEDILKQAGFDRDVEGDLRYNLIKTLTGHWLTSTGCSHEGAGSNTPACWCGWVGPVCPNVGTAAANWAAHACEEMRPALTAAVKWGP